MGLGNNMLLVMGFGALVSIPTLIAAYFYAIYIGKQVKAESELNENKEIIKSYEELVREYGKLPNGFLALAPIIIPILLMAFASIGAVLKWEGVFSAIVTFLGNPMVALAVGLLFGIQLLVTANKLGEFNKLTNETLQVVGPILFVTAAGGVLGSYLETGTMMQALGLTTPIAAVLTVMAIGAGSMTVSHANDSYFWVVTNFGEMKPQDGYKTQTIVTLIMGIVAMISIYIISLLIL